jgi:hypothetical protein
MSKTEHHNFTKAATCDYSSRMTSTNYFATKNVLHCNPDYYTPDWHIQKTGQQQKTEDIHQ